MVAALAWSGSRGTGVLSVEKPVSVYRWGAPEGGNMCP